MRIYRLLPTVYQALTRKLTPLLRQELHYQTVWSDAATAAKAAGAAAAQAEVAVVVAAEEVEVEAALAHPAAGAEASVARAVVVALGAAAEAAVAEVASLRPAPVRSPGIQALCALVSYDQPASSCTSKTMNYNRSATARAISSVPALPPMS
jgi:hypothetical protein